MAAAVDVQRQVGAKANVAMVTKDGKDVHHEIASAETAVGDGGVGA